MNAPDVLEMLDLPGIDSRIDWNALTADQCHRLIRGVGQLLSDMEPDVPTDGVLQRSVMLEETLLSFEPLKHRYTGLIHDAYNNPELRSTLGLRQGKTPFRDAHDLVAKTHRLRGYEAAGRAKIAAALTPVRPTERNRDDEVSVGDTKYPRLGALQATGRIHPTKLATALRVLEAVDQGAQAAGKDQAFRNQLRTVVEKDLIEKIEHTTPEEFSRYAARRKTDVLEAMDPPDHQFTTAQTSAMHGMWAKGQVRGNPNAYEWRVVTDAEGNEALKTIEAIANNPRTQQPDAAAHKAIEDEPPAKDHRTRGQKAVQALTDALRFSIGRIDHTDLPGGSGNHTQMIVVADYTTLLEHLRKELAEVLPEIDATRRDMLLRVLAQAELEHTAPTALVGPASGTGLHAPSSHPPLSALPTAQTTDLPTVLTQENLDQLQPRITQGMYTTYFPPEVVLRLLCDVRVSPVTLTGQRQVLSVGRRQRAFREHQRRAIIARDMGCAVPGCHWPAAWCETHHVMPWTQNGETSIDNGILLCSHHHAAVHAKMLTIRRVDGQTHIVQHPLIDPHQQPRKNYFWQS